MAEPEKMKQQSDAGALRYARTVLNALTSNVAVIDEQGIIVDTNLAWKTFGLSNEIRMEPDTIGINYLTVCDNALGEDARRSREVSKGIRRVITGEIEEFVIEYPCHGPDQEFWFYMRATRARGFDPVRVVISHEDITTLKLAQKSLSEKSQSLEDANAALRGLLHQRYEDKEKMEQAIFQNIREDVLPLVSLLQQQVQTPQSKELFALITTALKNISSPLIRRLTSLETVLTPREIQVARLIKVGKRTKEIADILNLSSTTVSFHRRNLRQKLNLNNTQTNLRSHLLSMSL